MAGNVTNTLIANITSQEQTTENVDVNRGTGNPAFNTDVGQFTTYKALNGTGVNNISFPTTGTGNVCTQVYIRNVDPAANIIVFWKPVPETLFQQIITLNPGDQIILWASPDGPTNQGISALQLQGSVDKALVEYFLGGNNV